MAEITIGNRAVEATVVKLRPGSEKKALEVMSRDGVNNVAFKIDGDTFVASGRDLDVSGIEAWGTVRHAGANGHVLKVDPEVLKPGFLQRWGLAGAGVGAVGMPLTGLLLGSLFGAMPGLAEFAIFAGIGAVVFGGGATGWAAATNWWNGRQAKRDKLAAYTAR